MTNYYLGLECKSFALFHSMDVDGHCAEVNDGEEGCEEVDV